jgi:AraC-like DNA-binding protein
MVSMRCKLLVDNEMRALGLIPIRIELGEVDLQNTPTDVQLKRLTHRLGLFGLEIMNDLRDQLIEKIKVSIIQWVHYLDDLPKSKISEYLSESTGKEYHYLSDLFSKATGITVEHFVILQKIERVKELLVDRELTLTEVAWKLNYSSVAHLSNQFKKITGLTPTVFKNIKGHKRENLESI